MIFRTRDMMQISGSVGTFGYSPSLTSRGGFECMDQSDLDYYRARIAEEEIAAQRATHPLAAESHKKLAEEYASLIVANDHPVTFKMQA